MSVLALDESGTHGTASFQVIAGVAVHELDVRPLERSVDGVLALYRDPLARTCTNTTCTRRTFGGNGCPFPPCTSRR